MHYWYEIRSSYIILNILQTSSQNKILRFINRICLTIEYDITVLAAITAAITIVMVLAISSLTMFKYSSSSNYLHIRDHIAQATIDKLKKKGNKNKTA